MFFQSPNEFQPNPKLFRVLRHDLLKQEVDSSINFIPARIPSSKQYYNKHENKSNNYVQQQKYIIQYRIGATNKKHKPPTAVSCASQTILPPSRAGFWVELSFADDRVGWTLRPLNSENRKEGEPATGGKEADGRAEARGITKASRRPAMANIHTECVCVCVVRAVVDEWRRERLSEIYFSLVWQRGSDIFISDDEWMRNNFTDFYYLLDLALFFVLGFGSDFF